MRTGSRSVGAWKHWTTSGIRRCCTSCAPRRPDYYALPLFFASGEVNFMTVATAVPGGFSEGDLERYEALANLLVPLLEIIQARRMTLGLLDAFVGPRISARILDGQVKRGDGERIEAAFWYSDLRGFTALAEALPADQLLQLLNDYFENCADAARRAAARSCSSSATRS
jgi:adenylate cyclase